MVYRRDGKNAVGGIIKESGTATTATANITFVAFQLIVFHAGNPQLPHLFVLSYGGLWKPAFTDKKDPKSQSQESDSQQDER